MEMEKFYVAPEVEKGFEGSIDQGSDLTWE